MKNKEIKEEYCKEFGYGSFNKYNENDYSKWLEKQLLIQRVSQQRELLLAFDTMREFDIKHDDIEESVDYFLKNKESYL